MFEHSMKIKDDEIRPFLRDTLYHKPKDVTLKHANEMLVTFAFIRHPLNRLVSSYNDKFKHNKWNKDTKLKRIVGLGEDIKMMRSDIMRRYRNVDPKQTDEYPSPKEFVRYILEQVNLHGPLILNRHWRPQYALCPFCSMDFDYIGDIQEMNEHVEFLSDLLDLKVFTGDYHIPNINRAC